MILASIIEFELASLSVLKVSSPLAHVEVAVIVARLDQSLTLNEGPPDDFFDLCPISLLNGEAYSDIHHDVRSLH